MTYDVTQVAFSLMVEEPTLPADVAILAANEWIANPRRGRLALTPAPEILELAMRSYSQDQQ